MAILDSIGAAIAACARAVPGGGVLVFFPSYSLLEACEQRWAVTAAKGDGRENSSSGGSGSAYGSASSSSSSSNSYGVNKSGGKGKGKGGKGKGKGEKGKGAGGRSSSSSSSSAPSWEAALSAATRKEVGSVLKFMSSRVFCT